MSKWLMVNDKISTSLIPEDEYNNPERKSKWLFTGETKIVTEFVAETWEEAVKMYDDWLNKYGK